MKMFGCIRVFIYLVSLTIPFENALGYAIKNSSPKLFKEKGLSNMFSDSTDYNIQSTNIGPILREKRDASEKLCLTCLKIRYHVPILVRIFTTTFNNDPHYHSSDDQQAILVVSSVSTAQKPIIIGQFHHGNSADDGYTENTHKSVEYSNDRKINNPYEETNTVNDNFSNEIKFVRPQDDDSAYKQQSSNNYYPISTDQTIKPVYQSTVESTNTPRRNIATNVKQNTFLNKDERGSLEVNSGEYFNTPTGISLDPIRPLRQPTRNSPPVDHNVST